MFQPVSLFIALRYGRASKGSAFTRFINRFALGGIALGLMALIIVLSVMNGFEGELKQRILGAVPQITLSEQQPMQQWQQHQQQLPMIAGVKQVMPFVQAEAVIQARGDMLVSMLRGAVAAPGENITSQLPPSLVDSLQVGSWRELRANSYHVIIGSGVANRLAVTVGDEIRLMTSDGAVYTPFGMVPSQRRFQVVGILSTQSEVDSGLAIVHGEDLNRLIRHPAGSVSGLQLQLTDAFDAPQVADTYRQQTHYQVTDWRSQFGQLFDAVAMEKRMMWLMLTLIIAVAAFNMVSALVMVINEKRQDIAILQTLGLTHRQIQQIFLLQGCYNGILGIAIGVTAGLLLAHYLNPLMSLLGVNLMAISPAGLPVIIEYHQIAIIIIAALLLCFVATLYPALMAAKTEPSEALKYD